jgi:hypothetical protein
MLNDSVRICLNDNLNMGLTFKVASAYFCLKLQHSFTCIFWNRLRLVKSFKNFRLQMLTKVQSLSAISDDSISGVPEKCLRFTN